MIFFLLGYPPNHPYNSNTGQRLSPQQQQQQQQMAFQASSNTNNISQVSPRQSTFTQGPQTQPQPNQTQQQWNAANTRLSLQQQQNPMLNAQLTVSFVFVSFYFFAANSFFYGEFEIFTANSKFLN